MDLGILRFSFTVSITWVKTYLWEAEQSSRSFCEGPKFRELPRPHIAHRLISRGPHRTMVPSVPFELERNHEDCFHQSGYYWANNVQKAQTHLCYNIDKMSDYASKELKTSRSDLQPVSSFRLLHTPCLKALCSPHRRWAFQGGLSF